MQIIRLANLLLVVAILGGVYTWSRANFGVPSRFSALAPLARPAVTAVGWVLLVYLVGDAALNVVTGYLTAPGVHYYSPHQNADAFWLGMAIRIAAGLVLGGSLIKLARGSHHAARH
jgi:hypothetical protein